MAPKRHFFRYTIHPSIENTLHLIALLSPEAPTLVTGILASAHTDDRLCVYLTVVILGLVHQYLTHLFTPQNQFIIYPSSCIQYGQDRRLGPP